MNVYRYMTYFWENKDKDKNTMPNKRTYLNVSK